MTPLLLVLAVFLVGFLAQPAAVAVEHADRLVAQASTRRTEREFADDVEEYVGQHRTEAERGWMQDWGVARVIR